MTDQKPTAEAEQIASDLQCRVDRQISDFLLRACHDLKTPIRAIRAHTELLLRNGESKISDCEQRLGFIVDGVKGIDLLVGSLVNYSIALQTEECSFQTISLDIVLRTVLAKLDQEVRDNQAEVTYDKLPRVWGDPDRLMQAFEQLILNALRHRGTDPPRIHITVEERADNWLVAIRDSGPGIDGRYLELIFKPFERLHGKNRPGTGLGLPACRAIVERHGGKIWAESEEGNGCAFLFTLPKAAL